MRLNLANVEEKEWFTEIEICYFFLGGLFYWTHLNGDISSGALAHVGDFRRIYSGMRINCFTFYRNYMYASSGW